MTGAGPASGQTVLLHEEADYVGFADPARVSSGWYVLGRSRDVGAGPVTVPVGRGEVVAYRDSAGALHATDPHCPHLGGHLGLGQVTADCLACPLHSWAWDAGGACARPEAEGRRLRVYPARDAWGLAWAWLGDGPPIPFPRPPGPEGAVAVRLPRQTVRAHPHVVLGNGFDAGHFGPLHGLIGAAGQLREDAPHRLVHRVTATLPRGGRWILTGAGGETLDAEFATHGAAMGTVEVLAPWRFGVLFTCRPLPGGGTRTQTVLFLPSRRLLPRALALVWSTTLEDLRQMETQRFRPAFTAADATLAEYARRTAAVPAWTGGGQPAPAGRLTGDQEPR